MNMMNTELISIAVMFAMLVLLNQAFAQMEIDQNEGDEIPRGKVTRQELDAFFK